MRKIRVLVVDDAVVVRKILTDVLSTDEDIEVAGVAANGRIALSKVTQVSPDILTMDIEMPEMDGIETLRELRKTHPNLPVIMFSTLTERGAVSTLDALAAGATDYLTKPANVGSVNLAKQRISEELIPKIKTLCGHVLPAKNVIPVKPAPEPKPETSTPTPTPRAIPVASRIDLIAIGSSTGGPNALSELVPTLPGDLPAPLVLTQHMPPVFTRMLAERLNEKSALEVREGEDGGVLKPGTLWIAPGDYHMTFVRKGVDVVIKLNQDPPENSCRPAVDPMLRSAVEIYGGHVLSVILTGMGQDGLIGSQVVRDAGGRVIAQDEATSVVWGMPGFVAKEGVADRVLPLGQIGSEIARVTKAQRSPV